MAHDDGSSSRSVDDDGTDIDECERRHGGSNHEVAAVRANWRRRGRVIARTAMSDEATPGMPSAATSGAEALPALRRSSPAGEAAEAGGEAVGGVANRATAGRFGAGRLGDRPPEGLVGDDRRQQAEPARPRRSSVSLERRRGPRRGRASAPAASPWPGAHAAAATVAAVARSE